MSSLFTDNTCTRRSYAKIKEAVKIPNLIELQKMSYSSFLQMDVKREERKNVGLQSVFTSVFPISDFTKIASLEFDSYTFEESKYTEAECRQRGMTYAAPLKITVRLVVYDPVAEGAAEGEDRTIRDIKEQEVYMGSIPLMTNSGSFIVNGTERVIVSQLHRSPGVIFDHDHGKTHSSGKLLYNARIIPHRGSWLDFDFDHKDLLWVRIDRKRKLPATAILRALGMSEEAILAYFYKAENYTFKAEGIFRELNLDLLAAQRAEIDIVDPKTKEVLIKKNRKFTKVVMEKIKKSGIKEMLIEEEHLMGKFLATDHIDESTGEILAEANTEITEEVLVTLKESFKRIKVIFTNLLTVGTFMRDTLATDKINSQEEALIEIYKRMRPGDPPTIEAAQVLFKNMFFNEERYDLSAVGRLKLNYKFPHNNIPSDLSVLKKEDILETVRYLCDLNNGIGVIDDIDHLGNRRVRAVGELLENQYRIGLVRMERAIKERMALQEIATLMPHDLINQKPVSAVVKEFFGSSQLSQFMDQTNPLSEITHKRRLSALGPGGLTRERAGFEVRDVHATHYGRICPVETPEGPNIGLIASLSAYAHVNEYGFIETPYRIVENGNLTDKIKYFSATEEENKVIAQADSKIIEEKSLGKNDIVSARRKGEFALVPSEEVELMDVSPNQLASIGASLIPFLEHDDANRALMGSNMQRQAVPLIKSHSPLVGTGVERSVARDSGAIVLAKHNGTVFCVDGGRVAIKRDKPAKDTSGLDNYNLIKYQRSNQDTCWLQQPRVRLGQKVKEGDVIADGPATERGELALGQNIVVALMPWNGYNFEDSILINENLIHNETFTSIHIQELECVARDTKLGKEEITRDIPNVGEDALKDLDSSGIVRIGAEVKTGDILVGKITPKGETQLSPEEKLLRAIFGEKAGDVLDTSLRVPSGISGTVIGAQIFAREGTDSNERTEKILADQVTALKRDETIEAKVIKEDTLKELKKILVGQKTTGDLLSNDGSKVLMEKGETITAEQLDSIQFELLAFIPLQQALEDKVTKLVQMARKKLDVVRSVFEERVDRLKRGDELAPGIIKMIHISLAIKRRIQVGDKMAGRHGNKGVISKIVPPEDMPYLSNGTPVDMVLNPLGVPSRMNIGQLLELMLGGACLGVGKRLNQMLAENCPQQKLRDVIKEVYSSPEVDKYIDAASTDELKRIVQNMKNGLHVSTPIFDSATEDDINRLLKIAELPEDSRYILFDGSTGEVFARDVTVGVMYILKLHHLVDEKIHARSIGPYSLVTQQPLGGKAQLGGQRLGEMEVWALEAYGAAYTLQEFLTVKSDDVTGRNRMYEAIVKGERILEPGLPESFNVLTKELQSLSLNVELIENNQE